MMSFVVDHVTVVQCICFLGVAAAAETIRLTYRALYL